MAGTSATKRLSPPTFTVALAAKELGVQPENCAVLEDSGAGIEAAKAAGMYCVAYSGTNVHGVDQSRADVVVDEYTNETLKYLVG